MLRIAIDGACRRNGTPDCLSAGGIFVELFDERGICLQTDTRSNYELNSTNQRGELTALLTAIVYVANGNIPAQIITDSEYIFNMMTKDWLNAWDRKGWVTAANEPVKNKDLLLVIKEHVDYCKPEITYYHIKGHVIPFGKVTAVKLLVEDKTGRLLRKAVSEKYDSLIPTKQDIVDAAQELSCRNNGFMLDDKIFKDFVVSNIVADAVATQCVDAVDRMEG